MPDFRNAKIATELVDFAKDWSINHGCLELASDCEYENTVSRKFHNNIGFVEANTIICFTMKMLSLIKAAIDDSQEILNMQIEAFKPLLLKYQDYSTNPAAENIDRIKQRMSNPLITHFFIKLNKIKIGQISVYQINETTCRISQMFIMPQYQNKGYAQEAIRLIESEFANIKVWELDTIKQEPKLCHLYEKMNYVFTGETKHIKEGMDIIFYRK